MKQTIYIALAAMAAAVAACSNDVYDDMPRQIQSFVAQYYPNSELASFTSTDSTYTAIIKNGPTMVFASNGRWISVNGNGSTLPQIFLYNELPSRLYGYLEETENTGNTFIAARNPRVYTITLLDSRLTYAIASGEITGEEISPE